MLRLAAALTLAVLVPTTATPTTPPERAPTEVERNIEYKTVDGQPLALDVYTNGPGSERPAVILLHGGEWVRGSKDGLEPEARRIAALGWVAIPVDYRLSGDDLWPGDFEDVTDAVQWVSDSADTLGIDPNRIALLGSSSGAHLAALVATSGQPPADGDAQVQAVALWSAPLDLTAEPGSDRSSRLPFVIVERYLGCTQDECPEKYTAASPVFHVDANTLPMYIANSEEEIIPVAHARQMADELTAAGVEHELRILPGDVHGLSADCTVRPCTRGYRDEVWDETIEFLRTHITEGTPSEGTEAAPATAVSQEDSAQPASEPPGVPSQSAAASSGVGAPVVIAIAAIAALAGAVAGWFGHSRRRSRSRPN